MDRFFRAIVDKHTPKVNPAIMEGLACSYKDMIDERIDNVWKSASRSFPPGLEYVGWARCTPDEEYWEETRPKTENRRSYDLAKSDLVLNRYHFRYQGIDLPPRYLYRPFWGRGGIIRLGGSTFHISPVMIDKIISPGNNSIFVRLLRDKITFERQLHTIMVNDRNESFQVVWSKLHRKPSNNNKTPVTTRAKSTMSHYLMAKYGFSAAFKKYAGFVPVVGEGEINQDNYPDSDWVICSSTGVRPRSVVGDPSYYEPTKIRLAIPIHCWNQFTKSLVSGLYYTLDHFPGRIKNQSYMENVALWKILLGNIVYSGVYGDGKLHGWISEHFNSLDQNVDTLVLPDLQAIDPTVEDFYDLIAMVMRNFDKWLLEYSENATSLFGKTMEVLYYALYDITSAIFTTGQKLSKASVKKPLTAKEINEIMNKFLKMRVIFGLTKGNIAVNSVSYSGDNLYPKITSVVGQQQAISGAMRGRRSRTVVDETKRLDVSFLEVGSIYFLSKSNPTPAVRANMFMNVDLRTGLIHPKPQFAAIREDIKKKLQGIGMSDFLTEDLAEGNFDAEADAAILLDDDVDSVETFSDE